MTLNIHRKSHNIIKHLLLLLFLNMAVQITCKATAIGQWKSYLSYKKISEIEKVGSDFFILASKNLYLYNSNDQSIRTFSKMDALSDCSIAHIAWNQKAKHLVIVYENENIDLLDLNGNCTNIADYYLKSIMGDKTVNNIYIYEQFAYLATGLGIIKIDVSKAEINNSYILGDRIESIAISGQNIYAYINQKFTNSWPSTVKYNHDGDILSLINYTSTWMNAVITAPLNANLIDAKNWTLTKNYPTNIFKKDMSVWNENIEFLQTLNPDSPQSNYFGFLRFFNGQLFSTVGGYGAGIQENRKGDVQVLKGDTWQFYQNDLNSITGYDYMDLTSLDVDPTDINHVFVSGRSGLYEFNNGQFTQAYDVDNSPIGTAISETDSNKKSYTLVESVKFDNDGNLWLLNSQSTTAPIIVRKKDGTWQSYSDTELMSGDRTMGALQGLTFDNEGLLWFVNNHWVTPSLHYFNTQTEQLHSFTDFINEDGTRVSVNSVQCIAIDKNNDIWIGTNITPLLLERKNLTESEPEFIQVKVPRNDGTNYADYLLNGVNISAIAIDGGNRKWFGTKGNGVYLISADNLTQLAHFTSENSNLFSDNIESIAINNQTGEVFFGTDKGLCSYMSDATEVADKLKKDDVYAYPNPVRPDYTGLITITGLTYDADIKIVTSNGTLVAQGRSNGGSFTWDGCDQSNGKRVASGVYMVLAATNEGNKGTVCKIAIIR